MATANVQFSFTVEDELSTKASILLYGTVTDTTTVATMNAEWETLAGLIDLVIGAQVLHGSVSLMDVPSGDEKAAPAAGSRVEQTAVLNFPVTGTGKRFGDAIASIADSVITGGTLDLGDTNVANLVTALQGAFGTGGQFTNNTYQPLDDLADAFVSFRKRRKQLSRSSFELPA